MLNVWNLSIKLAIIAVAIALTLSTIYIWILPRFFGEYKTYSFFVIGVAGTALWSSYVGYKNTLVTATMAAKLLTATICGLAVAILAAFFSLLIILNVMGS